MAAGSRALLPYRTPRRDVSVRGLGASSDCRFWPLASGRRGGWNVGCGRSPRSSVLSPDVVNKEPCWYLVDDHSAKTGDMGEAGATGTSAHLPSSAVLHYPRGTFLESIPSSLCQAVAVRWPVDGVTLYNRKSYRVSMCGPWREGTIGQCLPELRLHVWRIHFVSPTYTATKQGHQASNRPLHFRHYSLIMHDRHIPSTRTFKRLNARFAISRDSSLSVESVRFRNPHAFPSLLYPWARMRAEIQSGRLDRTWNVEALAALALMTSMSFSEYPQRQHMGAW